jgi:hypothetical protein
MATPTEYLDDVLSIDGAIGAAVVDYDSGITLGSKGGASIDMELAGAGHTQFVQSARAALHENDIAESIEDLLVTLEDQYHLTRFSEAHETLFTYVILSRADANLALARRQLARLEADLQVDADADEGLL